MDRERPPDPERWRRVQAILEEAFDLAPQDRAGFLDRACAGDGALRAEVAALLAADAEAEGLLDGPPGRYAASALAEILEDDTATPETFEGREIGPYRLLGPLGRGGMGEVFEAYDGRLDRTVALKRVRLGGSDADPLRRERFRREARAAAGLSHPGIVPVYDLLKVGGEDWIVMERAEGRNLAELLAEGPLAEHRALELGRDVAGALAAAHARGIVHRDLKAENVVVAANGRARLLDFGLAKRLPEPGGGAETGLTAEAVLLGTVRSMSPEQARGGEVGPSSDLFSLGVLLYEALTGESPFQHPSPAVTLSRIGSWRQPPACEVNPAVSPAASELVDHLLEKRPEDRPASAEEVLARIDRLAAAGRREPPGGRLRGRALAGLTAALVLAAVLGGLLWRRAAPEPVALHVAVLEPELSAGGEVEEGEMLVAALFAAVQQGLVALEGVAAVTPESLEAALRTPAAAPRALAADEVLRSRLDCRPRRCQISLSRLAPEDGRVLWIERFDVPLDDYDLLATAVAVHLRSAYPSFRPRPGAASAELPPGVYERYLRLLQRSREEASSGNPELLADLATLRADAPRFLEAYLLEARAARQSFYFSKDRALLDRAFGLLDAAAGVAPGDPRVFFELFDLARDSGRWPKAEQALASLRELAPSDAGVFKRRADLAAHQGRKGEALALMRQAAELRPSLSQLYNLALMEYQQGEIDAARATLGRLLERAPDSSRARSLLAQFELLDGSLERAVELYDQLAERSRGIVEISNRGLAELLLGRFESAAASYREAYGLEPGNPLLALNLADALLLSGEEEEARELYRQVVERLPEEDGEEWQSLTARAQALAHLGREREAVAAVQRALRLAPDNPQVAYEAAIVYGLQGDTARALLNAERALEAGLSARWFSLPWFDALRREPAFRALLPATPGAAGSASGRR